MPSRKTSHATADVVVVGMGLSGVLVARALAEAGLSVVGLDAGASPKARLPDQAAAFEAKLGPFLTVDDARWAYRCRGRRYEWLRVRAVGGRSLLWGGWMDRPDRAYFRARRAEGHPWPIGEEALRPWVLRAEKVLGVREGALPPSLLGLREREPALRPKREAVLERGHRAVTALDLLRRQGGAGGRRFRVVDEAVARRVLIDQAGRVRGVEVWRGDQDFRLAARAVVLAASPVETARILYGSPRAPSAGVGAKLHDHLVAGAVAIRPGRAVPSRARGAPDPAAALVLPGPHDEVRATVEIRGPKPLAALDDEDLSTLGFDRRSARRHVLYAVFALAETDPGARRRVTFDDLRPDDLGRPTPVFDFEGLTAHERAVGTALRRRVLGLGREIAGKDGAAHLIDDARSLGGAGHEAGTCPMGGGDDAVVDLRGRVRGANGLYVADASPLPGALDRHPSLTLAAYALRTAHQVERDLKS